MNLPHSIEDGQQVRDESLRYASSLGLKDNIIEGQEHAPHEEEEAKDGDGQAKVLEAFDIVDKDEAPRPGRQPRLDGEAGDGEEGEEHEGHGAHHPGEADRVVHLVHHDGQDDTADRRTRDHDAEGSGATAEEPRHQRRHAGVEDGAGADGGDDALREEELVVVGRQRHHHQAEDVGNGAAI